MCCMISGSLIKLKFSIYSINTLNTKRLNKNIFVFNSLVKNFNTIDANVFSKKNYLIFYFSYNGNFYYNFNKINNLYFINFINFINNFFKNSQKFLIIDSDYKMVTPLYNFSYGLKNIILEKNFFFLKKNFLTLNNFLYFYGLFIKK